MSFDYENIRNWLRKKVQESSATLNGQMDFAYKVEYALEEVLEELEKLRASQTGSQPFHGALTDGY